MPVKRIEIDEDTRLREMLGVSWCRVNSIHHQYVDRVGEGPRVAAHERRGMVQGVESANGQPFFGVQWHPEFLIFNRAQQRIYRALVQEAAAAQR